MCFNEPPQPTPQLWSYSLQQQVSHSSPPQSSEDEQHDNLSLDQEFQEFKLSAAALVRASSGRRRSSNPHMRRSVGDVGSHNRQGRSRSDPTYLERRERNNAAAKRSRDLRSSRLDNLLVEEAYLESCVPKLMDQLELLQQQIREGAARRRGHSSSYVTYTY